MTAIASPFDEFRAMVRPEWIDHNGHMNVGYYLVVFDLATDAFLAWVGLDAAHRRGHGVTTLCFEAHVTYHREVRAGDPLRFTTLLLAHDTKRLHYIHAMYHAEAGYLASTNELMSLHVSEATRRGTSWPPTCSSAPPASSELTTCPRARRRRDLRSASPLAPPPADAARPPYPCAGAPRSVRLDRHERWSLEIRGQDLEQQVLVGLVGLVVDGVIDVTRLEEDVAWRVDDGLVGQHVRHLPQRHQPDAGAHVVVLADVAARLERQLGHAELVLAVQLGEIARERALEPDLRGEPLGVDADRTGSCRLRTRLAWPDERAGQRQRREPPEQLTTIVMVLRHREPPLS